MKLLLAVVALVAVAHGAPTTHTMEIGADGVSGSILDVPLVEIVVNMIKDTDASGTVDPVEAEPVIVIDQALNPELVNVVDVAQNPEPVNVIDEVSAPVTVVEQPELPVNPIDVVSINPVAPTPEAVVVGVPAPIVLPAPAPAEVVASPEPVAVVPGPSPAEIIAAPEPVLVVPEPTEIIAVPQPVQVVDAAPETVAAEGEGNQIINVVLNFFFGDSGTLSSVEAPANVLPQISTARV